MKKILAPSVSAVNSADTAEGEHIDPSITRNATSMVENDNGCYPCSKNCVYCTLYIAYGCMGATLLPHMQPFGIDCSLYIRLAPVRCKTNTFTGGIGNSVSTSELGWVK